jgi:phosphoribosylamine---glycine ligase
MKVLLVGSGGREHALAWKLVQSRSLRALHAAPGNPGIAELGDCHPVRAEDPEGLLALAGSLDVDLVIVGPEAPLVDGVADELRHAGIAVFGPGKGAAQIEGSKTFAKEIMRTADVPTAASMAIARPPCVVKADGLAAGKGVAVCRTQAELDAGLAALSAYGGSFVIEELLEGQEVSVFALCDGREAVGLAPAQDYKRASDGDVGPNTGGMGAYAPARLTVSLEELLERVHRPVLRELARRGLPFVGLLYAGAMLTADGVKVLEFNCRFGDPETQSILPLIDGDLLETLAAAARGQLAGVSLRQRDGAAVTVVLAAADYPASGSRGSPIEGIDTAADPNVLVFHAGTALQQGRLVTNGGRILDVTGLGADVLQARARAYEAVSQIAFDGMRYRSDIASAVSRAPVV